MTVVRYSPGDLRVVASPAAVALLGEGTTDAAAEAVWLQLTRAAGLAGVVEALAAGGPLSSLPAFAVAIDEDGTWRVAVRGALTVSAGSGAAAEHVDGAGASTWTERSIRSAEALTIGPAGAPSPTLPVRDGVVAASGAMISRDESASPGAGEPAASPAAPVEPVQPHSIAEVHDASSDAEPTPPGKSASKPGPMRTPGPPAAPAPTAPPKGEPAASPKAEPAAPPKAEPPAPPKAEPPAPPAAPVRPAAPAAPVPPAVLDSVPPAVLDAVPPAVKGRTGGAGDAPTPAAGSPVPALAEDVEATIIRGTTDEPTDDATITLAEARALRASGQLPPVAPPLAPSPVPAAAGLLRTSTGQSVLLDRTVIVGRRPRSTRISGADLPHLVAVDSPQQDISRNHLEVRAEGDSILATDLNTTNGTTLLRRGSEPVRLHPGEPTIVVAGDVLDLGDGVTVSVEDAP